MNRNNVLTPHGFSLLLRDALKAGATPGPMALIPKNRRPFYEQVVVDYEATKQCYSPSGMTAAIVACWLKAQGKSFTITYNAEEGYFTVLRL